MPESLSFLHPFILSWNLRNIIERPSKFAPKEFCITGTCLGEYPIDAWKKYFLEVPKNGFKKDIVGRSYNAFGAGMKNTKWDGTRIVNLPVYAQLQYSSLEKLRLAIRHWNDIYISEDVPCIALAVKHQGWHSEGRETQSIAVLIVWNDAVARIISLDWTEGPIEDCITPEWYIETTPLLALKDAVEKMKAFYENAKEGGTSFSIYTIPSCLGCDMHGELVPTSYSSWIYEWKYPKYSELKHDLNFLLARIQSIFFNESRVSDING